MIDQSEFAKAEDEAANWAVLLADDPEDTELLKRFTAWLHASPLHAEIWRRTQRAYTALGQLKPTTQARWSPDVTHCGRTKHWKKPSAGLTVAACLVIGSLSDS